MIQIDENGLASQTPLRQAYDGITYFGCKKTLGKGARKELEADSGAPDLMSGPGDDDN